MIIFAVEESGGNTFSSAGDKSPSRKQATLSLAEMQFSVFPTGKQYLHFANRSARTIPKDSYTSNLWRERSQSSHRFATFLAKRG